MKGVDPLGGAVFLSDNCRLQISDSIFLQNEITKPSMPEIAGYGGAIALYNQAHITSCIKTYFWYNKAYNGGAISV